MVNSKPSLSHPHNPQSTRTKSQQPCCQHILRHRYWPCITSASMFCIDANIICRFCGGHKIAKYVLRLAACSSGQKCQIGIVTNMTVPCTLKLLVIFEVFGVEVPYICKCENIWQILCKIIQQLLTDSANIVKILCNFANRRILSANDICKWSGDN